MRGALLALRSGAVVAVLAVVARAARRRRADARSRPSTRRRRRATRRGAEQERGAAGEGRPRDRRRAQGTGRRHDRGGRRHRHGLDTRTCRPTAGRTFFDASRPTSPRTSCSATSRARCPNATGSEVSAREQHELLRLPDAAVLRRHLKDAGFTVLNLANNHAYDFGAGRSRGHRRPRSTGSGLAHTGRPGEVARQKVGTIRVAVLGFSTYPWSASMTNYAGVRKAVAKADRDADVVDRHGPHGRRRHRPPARRAPAPRSSSARTAATRCASRTPPIDAGADLVVGHGPHVLRGMEWYKGRLIAYSLGQLRRLPGLLARRAAVRSAASCASRWRVTAASRRACSCRRSSSARACPRSTRPSARTGSCACSPGADFGARGVRVSPTGDAHSRARLVATPCRVRLLAHRCSTREVACASSTWW